MVEPYFGAVPPAGEGETNTPNNLIIWLDKHIGRPEECVLLKSSFLMALNPASGLYERNLNKDDIDNSICFEAVLHVQLEDVEFMFQAFDNVEKCFEAIEKNRNKRISFITSGSKGKIIVPSLVINFPEMFGPHNRIFIFCGNMNMIAAEGVSRPTNDWALNFLEHVLMFDHQDDLLARMTMEIANYFAEEEKRLGDNQQFNEARQHHDWSQRMYRRHTTLLND